MRELRGSDFSREHKIFDHVHDDFVKALKFEPEADHRRVWDGNDINACPRLKLYLNCEFKEKPLEVQGKW